ncbi:hypothetical protein E2C01_045771 [Portunus trituberculatus]|uniref:Uncharacterized protein n=1 Tax=Portunus trituberculatus TaxID=210409 RepID=A0A5B7G5X2_PORTR|nr:hypothetical protein [Portunus trituberculatus]
MYPPLVHAVRWRDARGRGRGHDTRHTSCGKCGGYTLHQHHHHHHHRSCPCDPRQLKRWSSSSSSSSSSPSSSSNTTRTAMWLRPPPPLPPHHHPPPPPLLPNLTSPVNHSTAHNTASDSFLHLRLTLHSPPLQSHPYSETHPHRPRTFTLFKWL